MLYSRFFFLGLILLFPFRSSGQEVWVKILHNGTINEIELEEYVCGVLAGEISPSWPLESLKAMAVCARTFALNKIVDRFNRSYHLADNFFDQVYESRHSRVESIQKAVSDTKGEVVLYNEELAQVYFCASSGNCTASSFSVWGKDVPYLKAIPDPYSSRAEKYSSWMLVLDTSDLLNLLHIRGKVKDITVVSRDGSGRVNDLQISTNNKSYPFSGKRLRELLGFDRLHSTLFEVNFKGEKVIFTGQGWGHGVGLSQWGAKKMAEEGFDYKQILEFYFPGTVLGVIQ
ncbi:MAG: SpoIID/LytB domain-containing protein [Candidatus Omnitrophota bacterium]